MVASRSRTDYHCSRRVLRHQLRSLPQLRDMLALGVRSGRLKGADRTRSSFIDSDVLIVCRTARTWRPHNPLPLYIHPVIDILHSCIYCFHCTLPIFLQSPVLQWSECSSEQLLGVSTRLSSSVASLLAFVHQHKDFLLTSLYTAEICTYPLDLRLGIRY